MTDSSRAIDAVVFDLGGVLLDWDPRHLYRKLFADDERVEQFLTDVDLVAWHVREHDHGRPMDDTIPELCARFPEYEREITAWRDRYPETFAGSFDGTVRVLDELRGKVRLYALSNLPAEPVAEMRAAFPFLAWFDGIVISGEEQLAKPDPALFLRMCTRYRIDPSTGVFVDDVAANVEAATALGFRGVLFRSPEHLRDELVRMGVLAGLERGPIGSDS